MGSTCRLEYKCMLYPINSDAMLYWTLKYKKRIEKINLFWKSLFKKHLFYVQRTEKKNPQWSWYLYRYEEEFCFCNGNLTKSIVTLKKQISCIDTLQNSKMSLALPSGQRLWNKIRFNVQRCFDNLRGKHSILKNIIQKTNQSIDRHGWMFMLLLFSVRSFFVVAVVVVLPFQTQILQPGFGILFP